MASAAACWNVYTRLYGYTSMRTNIVIDDRLMQKTLKATGAKTKREAVEMGLRTLVRLEKQGRIRGLRGRLHWRGDLEALRTGR
jgi:Arc/MetJ family transcription regulator